MNVSKNNVLDLCALDVLSLTTITGYNKFEGILFVVFATTLCVVCDAGDRVLVVMDAVTVDLTTVLDPAGSNFISKNNGL